MGEGGESNPCFKPLYDETIDAPSRHTVGIDGSVAKQNALKIQQANTHQTIGPVRNFLGQPAAMNVSSSDGDNEVSPKKGTQALSELFQPPEQKVKSWCTLWCDEWVMSSSGQDLGPFDS